MVTTSPVQSISSAQGAQSTTRYFDSYEAVLKAITIPQSEADIENAYSEA